MRVLLIGKYPPMQGGISAKTYWLYKALEKAGFSFKVVTIQDEFHSIPDRELDDQKVTVVADREIPWHIPYTTLMDDRLISAALVTAKDFDPDVIETNYIWPFYKNAFLVSKILGKPLVLRHAGSDIQKFSSDPEFGSILKSYVSQASAVVTNSTSSDLIRGMCETREKVFCLERYLPDPDIFKPDDESDRVYDILFAGKINYHWRLKGLELLLKVVKRNGLKARFLLGGQYKDEVLELIRSHSIEDQCEISGFIAPEKMPRLYNSCRFAWCWEEKGLVEDFSNIIWEALFCDTACILNRDTFGSEKSGVIDPSFSGMLHAMDAKALNGLDSMPALAGRLGNQQEKQGLFERYVTSNEAVYHSLT